MSSAEALQGSSSIGTIGPIEALRFKISSFIISLENKIDFNPKKEINIKGLLFDTACNLRRSTQNTEKNPYNREAIIAIIEENTSRVFASEPLLDENYSNASFNLKSNQIVLGLVRSNSTSPVMPKDLTPLLENVDQPDKGASFILAVTPQYNEMYMRAHNTPLLNENQIAEIKEQWKDDMPNSGISKLIWGKPTDRTSAFINKYNIIKYSGPANSTVLNK